MVDDKQTFFKQAKRRLVKPYQQLINRHVGLWELVAFAEVQSEPPGRSVHKKTVLQLCKRRWLNGEVLYENAILSHFGESLPLTEHLVFFLWGHQNVLTDLLMEQGLAAGKGGFQWDDRLYGL